MGLDCEYPNSCSCGCQDEPVHTGCKCCGREVEHADDCLIPENARLRARADRYLAAIRAYLVAVDTAEDFATVDREEAPLRAIVEEARRG